MSRVIAAYMLTIVFVPLVIGGFKIVPELLGAASQLFRKPRGESIGFILVLVPRSLPQAFILSALGGFGAVLVSRGLFRMLGTVIPLFALVLAGLVAVLYEILVLRYDIRLRRQALSHMPTAEAVQPHDSLGARQTNVELRRSERRRFFANVAGLAAGLTIGITVIR